MKCGGRKVQMHIGMALESATVPGLVGIEIVEKDVNFLGARPCAVGTKNDRALVPHLEGAHGHQHGLALMFE